jgi:hypothetical protein
VSLVPTTPRLPRRSGRPPTTELGVVNPLAASQLPGVPSWSSIAQIDEHVPDLVWPQSIETYRRMAHNAQVGGLTRATINPIRRYHWSIRPGDADEALARKLADDLDLPIEGEATTKRIRTQGRFVWSDFVRLALYAPTRYGHYFFEQVGFIDKDGDFRYRKIAERPPSTITSIFSAADGGLLGIQQSNQAGTIIPVDRLVSFVWEQENGVWTGVPMLRDLYTSWLLIDRLCRVDLAKHERNAMGIPFAKLAEGAGPAEEAAALETVKAIRAGGNAGGVEPYNVDIRLKGVEGGTSDPLASIQHYEQLMSRSWLAMLMELGQTRTGSKALSSTFLDFFSLGLDCIADWLRGVVQAYIIEDFFNWNVGEDAPCAQLIYAPLEADLAVADFAALVTSGALQVDDALEEEIRQRYNLPPRTTPRVEAPAAGSTGGAAIPGPSSKPAVPGGADGAVAMSSTRRYSRVVTPLTRPRDHVHLAAPSDPRLRRELSPLEVQAAFNPGALDDAYQAALAQALATLRTGRAEQVRELAEKVAAASTNLQLASLSATPQDAAVLASVLEQAMQAGARQAAQEAAAQGQSLDTDGPTNATQLSADRASAIQVLLARRLSESASAKALNLTQRAGSIDVADEVRSHLDSLNDAWLRDQVGGAVTSAINAGRVAAFSTGAPPKTILSSEILDAQCCSPCRAVDGKTYASMAAAQLDYPTGGYRSCDGGPRCRGTILVIFPT